MNTSGIDTNSDPLAGLSIKNSQANVEESDKDMFLKLMLAQLKNQNPLQPQDGAEFLSQMAQFSTVEGIGNLNKGIDELNSLYRSNQALQATALVGRDVLASGDTGYLDASNSISGVVHPDGASATNVMVSIKNEAGATVRQVAMGTINGDTDTPFTWDGTDADGKRLPVGNYTMEINGHVGDKSEALRTSMFAKVNSVSIINNQGDMLLNLNGMGKISSTSILQVK